MRVHSGKGRMKTAQLDNSYWKYFSRLDPKMKLLDILIRDTYKDILTPKD